jgi:hypothetical protein
MTSSYRVRYRFGYERQACSFEFMVTGALTATSDGEG